MKSNQLYPEDSSAKRKIISYAYLAQASKSDGDLIGGISPIFKPIAKIKTGQVFEPKEFCEIVNDLYGLKILPWAAEDLVRRLEHNEILVKNNVVDKVDEYLYAEIREEFTEVTDKDIIFLTDKFINFSRPILGQYELAIDEATLAKDFLEHLTDLNFISIALSPTQYDENEQSENTLSLKVGEQSEQEISARRNLKEEFQEKARLNMLCASFVLDAYNSNQQLYELIVRIVSGALVAEMVLNFQEPEVDADLSQVTFIFDTPLLMAIMDLSSEKEHEFAIGLFKDMASKGAKFAVYEHSADELRSNLKAVKQKHEEKRSFGATARRLKGESFFRYFEEVCVYR